MQIDPTTRSSRGKSVGQFPTLFTTVLESNALLREEIDQMEESEYTAFIGVVVCALRQGKVNTRGR